VFRVRHVSWLFFFNVELKEKNIDIENSTQVMRDLFEDVKHNCSSNKTEIDTLKRRFEEVVERTFMNSLSIPSVYSRGDSNSPVKIKLFFIDLHFKSVISVFIFSCSCLCSLNSSRLIDVLSTKNNLIFTGLFESPREYTEGILREFIKST
jgi:hypothetical protein